MTFNISYKYYVSFHLLLHCSSLYYSFFKGSLLYFFFTTHLMIYCINFSFGFPILYKLFKMLRTLTFLCDFINSHIVTCVFFIIYFSRILIIIIFFNLAFSFSIFVRLEKWYYSLSSTLQLRHWLQKDFVSLKPNLNQDV